MREWLKRAVLKTAVPERVPGVRIPLPPPPSLIRGEIRLHYCKNRSKSRLPRQHAEPKKWSNPGAFRTPRHLRTSLGQANAAHQVLEARVGVQAIEDRFNLKVDQQIVAFLEALL